MLHPDLFSFVNLYLAFKFHCLIPTYIRTKQDELLILENFYMDPPENYTATPKWIMHSYHFDHHPMKFILMKNKEIYKPYANGLSGCKMNSIPISSTNNIA